ncbi:MAG: hypothetical protein IMX00_03930 [Limnochordales bacterium]|nr:hypothetical protein [Limnochordales bacterium]
MGSPAVHHKVARTIAATLHFWLLTTAAPDAGIPGALAASSSADSLWAVAYTLEYRDAGLFRLVYAGYLRPVTAGRPAASRIETSPDPGPDGTPLGWPDGITITAPELAAAIRRGHDQANGSSPPSLDGLHEGAVLLVLARPAEDGPVLHSPGHAPPSLVLLTPLVIFLDPEGFLHRQQLVEELLQRLGVRESSYSSGPSPGPPPDPKGELPAGPGS